MDNQSQKNPKPWFNVFSFGSKTRTVENFYDPTQFKWAAYLEENREVFYSEIIHFITHNEKELDSFYSDQKKWKSFGLYAWSVCLSKKRCLHFPKSMEILKQVPDVVTIMVGVMEPHSEIKAHYGDTDAVYRCHLGLVVPGHFPDLGIAVGDEKKGWEEGKVIVFNDAKYHYTWNNTDHRRIVLIVDIFKPEYQKQKTNICSIVLTSLTIQKIKQKLFFFPPFRLLPVSLAYPLIRLLTFCYLKSNEKSKDFLLQ